MHRPVSGPKPAIALPRGAVDSHCHMYLPGYPALPGGPANPPEPLPTPAMYRGLMDWLGIDRMIVAQGNAQQDDNASLLACLAEMGSVARGIAAIKPDVGGAEIARLADAGVIGLRIMDLPGGAVGLDALEALDAIAFDMGWVLVTQFNGNRVQELEPRLAALRARWVFDHHGKFFDGALPDGPEVAATQRLIDGGKCWFKLAGCYESSKAGGPDFPDIAALTMKIADHAPERLLWGSNWPHNMAKTEADYPDDQALLDCVLGWLDAPTRQKTLVDNPEAFFNLPPFD
ncbi:amidohydrolase family protein [Pseudooceanicola algae]|uniref:D-galactarolactone isomerase n=1 Tax=Pseudooceanicola algae TaxID=1537215 RepID=A0A418SCZ7_9RHOB|nr:amidohydrolase family protein [Pseudooceanicola algae]QPM92333.1 D-galactarolactone isomerase [Pseudooceanicola algae]